MAETLGFVKEINSGTTEPPKARGKINKSFLMNTWKFQVSTGYLLTGEHQKRFFPLQYYEVRGVEVGGDPINSPLRYIIKLFLVVWPRCY